MDALTNWCYFGYFGHALVLFWVFWMCFMSSVYEVAYMVRISVPRGTVLAQWILCCGLVR